MNELTVADKQNIIALLNRVSITGQEAETVAVIKQKLANQLKDENGGDTENNANDL